MSGGSAVTGRPVVITGREVRTCFGATRETFAALLAGRTGVGPLRYGSAERLGVGNGYLIAPPDPPTGEGAGDDPAVWLARCVAEAAAQAGLDTAVQRVSVVVGTGLRQTREMERRHLAGAPADLPALHFTGAVRTALPGVREVLTLANACSASGHALALAADLLAADEADAVIAAGCDTLSESMLAMIGRVAEHPTDVLRPFDRDRRGVLLGDGAAAVVVQRAADAAPGRALGRVLGVGLSCDAYHETAPDPEGILRAVRDAYERAGTKPSEVDLVLAHGTGTALNDPTEAAVLREVFADSAPGPLVTGIKGSIGHTSGAAALTSLVVALEAIRTGQVPPVAGLRTPIPEAAGLRLVAGGAVRAPVRTAQVNAFGFGGLNAVALVEGVPLTPEGAAT